MTQEWFKVRNVNGFMMPDFSDGPGFIQDPLPLESPKEWPAELAATEEPSDDRSA